MIVLVLLAVWACVRSSTASNAAFAVNGYTCVPLSTTTTVYDTLLYCIGNNQVSRFLNLGLSSASLYSTFLYCTVQYCTTFLAVFVPTMIFDIIHKIQLCHNSVQCSGCGRVCVTDPTWFNQILYSLFQRHHKDTRRTTVNRT